MRSQDQSRASRVQRERHAERGGGALAGVVVGRRADAAAREDDVAARERLPQVGGDARAVVADIARPREREATRGEQLDHLRQVLVLALAREDLVADDDRPKFMAREAAARWRRRRPDARHPASWGQAALVGVRRARLPAPPAGNARTTAPRTQRPAYRSRSPPAPARAHMATNSTPRPTAGSARRPDSRSDTPMPSSAARCRCISSRRSSPLAWSASMS